MVPLRYVEQIMQILKLDDMEQDELVQIRDYCNELIRKTEPATYNGFKAGDIVLPPLGLTEIQLPIDPIGDSITLGEMDDKLYKDIDKEVGDDLLAKGEITEAEYNELFQQDKHDTNEFLEDELERRRTEYHNDRPIDP